jgi:regulatory protein
MRRAHSIYEMREYLGRRAQDEQKVRAIIARLCDQHYLDDARYALEYARQHAMARRQGPFRIARELRARGVAEGDIKAALDHVFTETDETALARSRLKRQLARARGPVDERKAASLYRSLLRAGFSSDIIRRELRRAAGAEAPDFSNSEGE